MNEKSPIEGLGQIKQAVDKREELITHVSQTFKIIERAIFEHYPNSWFYNLETPDRKCLFETFFKVIECKMKPVVSMLYSALNRLHPQFGFTNDQISKELKYHIFLELTNDPEGVLKDDYDNHCKTVGEWANG